MSLSTSPSENIWTLLMPTVISSNFKEIYNCREGKIETKREQKGSRKSQPQFPRFIFPLSSKPTLRPVATQAMEQLIVCRTKEPEVKMTQNLNRVKPKQLNSATSSKIVDKRLHF